MDGWQLGWVVKDLQCREGTGKGVTVQGPWGPPEGRNLM